MEGYTDRLIVTNVTDIKIDGGLYEAVKGRDWKKAKVVSAGKSPNGDSNKKLEGKEILFFAEVVPTPIPEGEEMFLMKRTNIEVIL